jgi:hypothetical protein
MFPMESPLLSNLIVLTERILQLVSKYLSAVTKCYMIATCMSYYKWGLDW